MKNDNIILFFIGLLCLVSLKSSKKRSNIGFIHKKKQGMLIVRWSAYIHSDVKRNWSSWNFGQEGFEGTKSQLDKALSKVTDENPIWISGYDLYPKDLRNAKFGELYNNYWVLIDDRGYGLSCHIIDDVESLEDAIHVVNTNKSKYDGTGDGDFVDCSNAEILYSNTTDGTWGFHILFIPE